MRFFSYKDPEQNTREQISFRILRLEHHFQVAQKQRKGGCATRKTRECHSVAKGETAMATTKHAAVPSLIKAVRITQYGGSEQLKYEEAPLPEIGPGHVLAKVRYAGLNPIDWKIREGYMKQVRPA